MTVLTQKLYMLSGKPDCVVEKYTSRREGFEGGVEAVAKFGEGELVFTAQR